mmetsp:Transcript_111027/g.353800  ORF Transcript_111027/g.353800 Transcript_111027/m.353800 type:complete len:267 (-) Transcript_111027:219-1019(-)
MHHGFVVLRPPIRTCSVRPVVTPDRLRVRFLVAWATELPDGLKDGLHGHGVGFGEAASATYQDLQAPDDILEGQPTILDQALAQQKVVVVDGMDGRYNVLQMDLELRWHRVHASVNLRPEILSRAEGSIAEGPRSPHLILPKLLVGHLPTCFVEPLNQCQTLCRVSKQMPPIRQVAVRRDGVEVARTARQQIVVDDDVGSLQSQGETQRESAAPLHAVQERHADVLRILAWGIGQIVVATVAEGKYGRATFVAARTSLRLVAELNL